MSLHFLAQTFKFVYADGGEYTFSGSVGVCRDNYQTDIKQGKTITAVYQLRNTKFVKISD